MLLKKCSSYKSYFVPFSFNCLCKNIKSIPFSMEKKIYSNLVEFQPKNNRISTAIKMPQKWSIFYYQSVNQVWKGLDYHLFSFTANTIFGATTIWQCQKLCRVMTGKMLSRWKCKPGCSTLNPWFENKEPDAVPSLHSPSPVLLLWDGKWRKGSQQGAGLSAQSQK